VLPIFPFSCVGPSPEFQEEQNASQVKTVAWSLLVSNKKTHSYQEVSPPL
jgi:hypothetical protein